MEGLAQMIGSHVHYLFGIFHPLGIPRQRRMNHVDEVLNPLQRRVGLLDLTVGKLTPGHFGIHLHQFREEEALLR